MSLIGEHLHVTIACGGTGGHLFPGLAVADELSRRGARVTLMVSSKEIDQLALKTTKGFEIVTLPAVGLAGRRIGSFLKGFVRSYGMAAKVFGKTTSQAVLAMGGFTSAPPVLAGKRFGASTFLHESNSIPGRANRWLSWVVERAFIGFPSAAGRLHTRNCSVTGTPVRFQFQQGDALACRSALGLDPSRPVALVMGGSQGAHGINQLVLRSLPLLAQERTRWQWIHLAGPDDVAELRSRYAALGLTAVVYSFLAEVERALGAATACISRAGASSLAELAAMRLPSVLIPFPAATDNHQLHNARAFESTGAARLLEQRSAGPEDLARVFAELMLEEPVRHRMQAALAAWHRPQAADQIAQAILESVRKRIEPQQTALAGKRSGPPQDTGTPFSAAGDWDGCRGAWRCLPGKGGAL